MRKEYIGKVTKNEGDFEVEEFKLEAFHADQQATNHQIYQALNERICTDYKKRL